MNKGKIILRSWGREKSTGGRGEKKARGGAKTPSKSKQDSYKCNY